MYWQKTLVQTVGRFFPGALLCGETTAKQVALTIDDVRLSGPESAATGWILDAIAHYNCTRPNALPAVQATFFAITDAPLPQSTPLFQRFRQDGHELGNHGTADEKSFRLPIQHFQAHFETAHARLQSASPRWCRLGYGLYNRPMLEILRQASDYESRFALASAPPLDTMRWRHPALISAYWETLVFPGAILVLHGGDAGRSRHTAATLRRLLPRLQQRGYHITTLSTLCPPSAQPATLPIEPLGSVVDPPDLE